MAPTYPYGQAHDIFLLDKAGVLAEMEDWEVQYDAGDATHLLYKYSYPQYHARIHWRQDGSIQSMVIELPDTAHSLDSCHKLEWAWGQFGTLPLIGTYFRSLLQDYAKQIAFGHETPSLRIRDTNYAVRIAAPNRLIVEWHPVKFYK